MWKKRVDGDGALSIAAAGPTGIPRGSASPADASSSIIMDMIQQTQCT
jgi:hypothetical protein